MKKILLLSILAALALTLIMLITAGCKKEEPESDKIGAPEDLLTLTPEYQPGTYRNFDKIYNTRTIRKGTTTYPLPNASQPLTSVKYSPDGVNTYDIDDFVERNQVAGLLIIKNGQIVLEKYAQGNTPSSKWTSFSVAKSITSTLIGMAVKDGKISSLNDNILQYLPEMVGTAYDGVTVRQLLQMSSGAGWNEDYADPSSDLVKMFQALLSGEAGGILEIMKNLPRVVEPGNIFIYSTGETCLEGEVLRAALGGETLSDYFSRKIWANMGMESDAYWLLESPGGQEFAGGNISMTLRDYGRMGLFMLNNGVVNGQSLLPANWIQDATRPAADSPQCGYGVLYSEANGAAYPYNYPLGYGYNWWSFPESSWGAWDYLEDVTWWGEDAINPTNKRLTNLEGSYEAEGIFGQFIHINPAQNIVTVLWSTWSSSWIDPKEFEFYCFMDAAAEALK